LFDKRKSKGREILRRLRRWSRAVESGVKEEKPALEHEYYKSGLNTLPYRR